jgi:hypothetical protein
VGTECDQSLVCFVVITSIQENPWKSTPKRVLVCRFVDCHTLIGSLHTCRCNYNQGQIHRVVSF